MGRGFFGIQVRFVEISNGLILFTEPFYLLKTWKMGIDTRSCCTYTWDMGTYADFPRWSSCLHWLSFRSCRVCAPSLVLSLFPEYIPVLTIYYLFPPLLRSFLYRMKALLFTLIRAFEFELAVPVEDIGKKSTIVQRPVILSDPAGGNRMPLLLKPVQ